MGLLDDIKESNSEYKPDLSKDGLTRMIEKVFKETLDVGPSITLYTGLTGYYTFNLCMMGFNTPMVYYTFSNTHKRKNGIIVLNLYEKAGLIKAVINTRTRIVEIRKGTELLKEAFVFDDIKDYLSSLGNTSPKEFYTPKGIRKFIK